MTEPTYDRVMQRIKLSDPDKAAEIDHFLNIWRKSSSHGIRIVDNIRADTHIPEDTLESIFSRIHPYHHLSPEKFENEIYKQACYLHCLKGPVIHDSLISKNIGGAKTIDDFKTALIKGRKYMTEDRALKLIAKLTSPKTKHLTMAEKNIPLAPYFSWATWSESNQNNPFDFVTDPQEIIKLLANLGLSHQQQTYHHLLFVYAKANAGELKIPTIADGNSYSYFKPVTGKDYCSRTVPWNPEECVMRGLKPEEVLPRPEAVHKPITLAHLERPVRIIK